MRKPSKGGRKNLAKFFSVKTNATLWCESLLEMSFMYLLDFDPEVKSFKEQPCRIHYMRDGRRRSYTPDLLVVRASQKQIVEVKPAAKAKTEENVWLFNAIAPICEREGFKFRVATDETILQQPRLNNVKSLWRYARTPLRAQHQILCREFLCADPQVPLLELFDLFASKGVSRQVVYALLFWGALDFDLSQPLLQDSPIYLPAHATSPAREVS